MRTTVTLDDDVAAAVKRIQRDRNRTFKDVLNAALREGLARIEKPEPPGEPFELKSVDLGKCHFPDVACIAELLEIVEGPDFK